MSVGITSQNARHDEQFIWKLELHEIGNQIQLAQMQSRNSLAAKLGLPRRHQHDEYYTVTVHLDGCLNKWQSNLPNDWKLENIKEAPTRKSRAERYTLHIRQVNKIFVALLSRVRLPLLINMISDIIGVVLSSIESSCTNQCLRVFTPSDPVLQRRRHPRLLV